MFSATQVSLKKLLRCSEVLLALHFKLLHIKSMEKNNFVHLSSCARAFLSPRFGNRKHIELIIQLNKQSEATLSISNKKPSGQERTKGQEHVQNPYIKGTDAYLLLLFSFQSKLNCRELPILVHWHTIFYTSDLDDLPRTNQVNRAENFCGLCFSGAKHKSSLCLPLSLRTFPNYDKDVSKTPVEWGDVIDPSYQQKDCNK